MLRTTIPGGILNEENSRNGIVGKKRSPTFCHHHVNDAALDEPPDTPVDPQPADAAPGEQFDIVAVNYRSFDFAPYEPSLSLPAPSRFLTISFNHIIDLIAFSVTTHIIARFRYLFSKACAVKFLSKYTLR